MVQYIDKFALVAEINQRVEDYKSHKIDDSYHDGLIFALEDLRDDFINTLEVKDVDSNDAFVEKVINFLNYKLDDIVAIRVSGTIIPHHIVKPELIEDFKKYMEESKV